MRRNETGREILKTILYIGMVPVVAALLFLYVWLGEEVRACAVKLDSLRSQEITLRGEYNLVLSERNRLHRPDNLSKLARENLGLTQPDPETREIRVNLK
ncbi:MAG: cell division protein FtsL [Candidatus Marinimicrobia bacterium]|nr:cell division protein FtsL [Candidatus Neomarinimicrobiota bacterium]